MKEKIRKMRNWRQHATCALLSSPLAFSKQENKLTDLK